MMGTAEKTEKEKMAGAAIDKSSDRFRQNMLYNPTYLSTVSTFQTMEALYNENKKEARTTYPKLRYLASIVKMSMGNDDFKVGKKTISIKSDLLEKSVRIIPTGLLLLKIGIGFAIDTTVRAPMHAVNWLAKIRATPGAKELMATQEETKNLEPGTQEYKNTLNEILDKSKIFQSTAKERDMFIIQRRGLRIGRYANPIAMALKAVLLAPIDVIALVHEPIHFARKKLWLIVYLRLHSYIRHLNEHIL